MVRADTDGSVLSEFVRSSPVGAVASAIDDGRILDVNESLLQLTGLERPAVLGKTLAQLGFRGVPAHQPAADSLMMAAQPQSGVAATIRTASGEDRHLLVATAPVSNGDRPYLLTEMYDPSNADQIEHRFRDLVEHLPVVTYECSPDDVMNLTYISPQIEQLLGYTPRDILAGQPDFLSARMLPADRATVAAEVAHRRLSGEPLRVRYPIQTRGGDWVFLRDEATLVRDAEGRPLRWQGVLIDITAQRAAEERERVAQQRYRELFDNAPAMYVITHSKSGVPYIADCNNTFLTTLDYRREEVIDRPLADFYAPASRAALFGGGYSAALTGTLPITERQLVTKNGAILDVLLLANPDPRPAADASGTRVTFVDITARKAAEAALQENDRRFRELVQNSYDVIVVLDAHGRRKYVSPSIQRFLGYAPEDLIGHNVGDLVHPSDVSRLDEAIAACLGGARTVPVFELRLRHRDGGWRDFEAIGTNLLDEPSVRGVVFNSRDITLRKAAEAALRESEARFHNAFDHAASGMALIDLDGRFLQVNHSLCDILAYAEADLLGRTFPEVTLPEDVAIDRVQAQSLLDGEISSYQLEKRLLRGTGAQIWARVTVSVVQEPGAPSPYFVVQIQDITPFKAAGAALRESEQRFRSAFDHAPIGMALVAANGRFTQVNHALCQIVGYREEELLGKTFRDITHPDDLKDDLDMSRRMWAGEIDSYQIEKRYLHQDGHVVWVHITRTVVREDGAPKYGIAQIMDITERRQLDLARASTLARERDYARQIRALSDMRTDLTAMIAHELRAPVSALRMMTYLLETKGLSAQEETEIYATIKEEIGHLDRLIDDVAAVTVAEREDFAVELRAVPVAALLESASAYAFTALASHPFTVCQAPDVHVWCDQERITQVLRNLLANAAKHTAVGTLVELRAHCDGPLLRIEVADRGPGLSEEDIALIFEKFGRGRHAASLQVPGAGLGLYLSRRILMAHNSDLRVDSKPGQGTVFSFTLEIAES